MSSSNQSLIQRNAQLSLFYQLEQRKVQKLEEKVQALLLRNQSLLSDNDEERLKLLVADQTKVIYIYKYKLIKYKIYIYIFFLAKINTIKICCK